MLPEQPTGTLILALVNNDLELSKKKELVDKANAILIRLGKFMLTT